MKIRILLPLLLLFSGLSLFAQIAVKLEAPYPVYMKYDAVHVRIMLRNYTSHPIAFGSSKNLQGEIQFNILTPARTIARLSDRSLRPRLQGVILAPGEARSFTFNLARYFNLQEEGLYSIRAVVRHPQLAASYESNETTFKIRSGQTVWKREIGLPDYIGKNADKTIHRRTYRLLTFSDGRNMYYCMMIDDRDHVYAVRRIGFDIGSNLKPQLQIDSLARFHIMVAVTPKVYAHYVYDYTGRLERRDVYIRTSSTPFLVLDPKKAEVSVDGGRMARKDVDYEDLKELPFLDEVKAERENVFETKNEEE